MAGAHALEELDVLIHLRHSRDLAITGMGAGHGQPGLLEQGVDLRRGYGAEQVAGLDSRVAGPRHVTQDARQVLSRSLAEDNQLYPDPWTAHP